MVSGQESLRKRFPRHHEVPFLLGLALATLPLGLLLPTVTLSKIGGASEFTFSVVTGILDLARSGNLFLALVIFTFSFLFPIVKLTALWILWFRRMDPESRENTLHHLKVLGKWSMLDVFVVVVFVGAVQFGFLAFARPRFGIYLFSIAVILSMVVTFLEYRLARVEPQGARTKRPPSLAALPTAVLAFLFLVAGMDLPLMEVKKWILWNRDYSVLAGTAAMFRAGNYLIAGIVATFVVAVPLVTLLGQIALLFIRRSRTSSGKLVTFLGFLEKWTMVDVFVLGLLIVVVKIGAIAEVSPRVGMGCLVAGVILSMSTSWLMKG